MSSACVEPESSRLGQEELKLVDADGRFWDLGYDRYMFVICLVYRCYELNSCWFRSGPDFEWPS